jgi:hypothetical protein
VSEVAIVGPTVHGLREEGRGLGDTVVLQALPYSSVGDMVRYDGQHLPTKRFRVLRNIWFYVWRAVAIFLAFVLWVSIVGAVFFFMAAYALKKLGL